MSGHSAKVSLIVPVYNVEKYLDRCMESCMEQTLLDLEIICVDDGSTDRSGEMLDAYAGKDSRITVIHKQNGGVSSARNMGIDAAKGEWIMFLDSDDYLSPNACERVWATAMDEETDVVVFGADYFPESPFPQNGGWLNYVLTVRAVRFRKFTPKILISEPGGTPFVWHQAFSSALLDRFNIRFDETVKFAEDALFQFAAFPRAQSFAFISDTLYHYRIVRKDSLMEIANKNPAEKVAWHIKIVDHVIGSWEEMGIAKRYEGDLMYWAADYVLWQLFNNPIENKAKYLEDFYEVLRKHGIKRPFDELSLKQKRLLSILKKQ